MSHRLFLLVVALLLAALPAQAKWIGTWAAAPQPTFPQPHQFQDQTLRLIVHVSAGGHRARVHISNLYGDTPLVIGAAHVALRMGGAVVIADRTLLFAGRARVVVPAHGSIVSDPVSMPVPAASDLAVSLYLPESTVATTEHALAQQTNYIAAGNVAGEPTLTDAKPLKSWPFLTGVDVDTMRGTTIVAFGDSLIDGDGGTADTNRRFTDALAERLPGLGILNEGIIGNRLLRGSPARSAAQVGGALGEAALARFDRDVLSQSDVSAVIVRIGINDIGAPGLLADDSEAATAGDIEDGFRQLAARAHAKGLKIVVTTIGPFEGAFYYTQAKEALRQAVNAWLRQQRDSGTDFDAVADLDVMLRDPAHPTRLLPAYDSGDHLHTNDSGYSVAAGAMPLALLGAL